MITTLQSVIAFGKKLFMYLEGFADELLPDGTLTNGSWRQKDVPSIISSCAPRKANKPRQDACLVRETFARYIFGPGQVPCQWKSLL